jgi:hypothetical protein
MFRVLMIPLVLTGTLILNACVAPSVITENKVVYVIEPPIYQHCKTEPVAPSVGASNREWMEYREAMKAYGNDCEAKVNGGRDWAATKVAPPSESLQETTEE